MTYKIYSCCYLPWHFWDNAMTALSQYQDHVLKWYIGFGVPVGQHCKGSHEFTLSQVGDKQSGKELFIYTLSL